MIDKIRNKAQYNQVLKLMEMLFCKECSKANILNYLQPVFFDKVGLRIVSRERRSL